MINKEQEILNAAEMMVREGGYNNFSFRDVASAVGVKSSSVHYHFPTKADLAAAVAKKYTENFLGLLGAPEDLIRDGKDPIEAYVAAFKRALTVDRRMCLCGVLGAEVDGLPDQVSSQIRESFETNVKWLTSAYSKRDGRKNAKAKALQTYSLLEGALITSNVLDSIRSFDQIADLVKSI